MKQGQIRSGQVRYASPQKKLKLVHVFLEFFRTRLGQGPIYPLEFPQTAVLFLLSGKTWIVSKALFHQKIQLVLRTAQFQRKKYRRISLLYLTPRSWPQLGTNSEFCQHQNMGKSSWPGNACQISYRAPSISKLVALDKAHKGRIPTHPFPFVCPTA